MPQGKSLPEGDTLLDKSLLVVDNDKQIVELIKEILEYQGFNAVTAFCAAAAVDRVKEGKYSCAILDYALPDAKGDELARDLKREEPGIRLILLTGFKSSIDPKKLELFDYVFEKPVKLDEITAAVRLITGRNVAKHERDLALESNRYSLKMSARERQR